MHKLYQVNRALNFMFIDYKIKYLQWKYALKLSALDDGTFRVELDEADPLYPRYRTQLSLQGEPKPDGYVYF